MKIFLSSRYSRRNELCAVRDLLRLDGHTVTSRWLDTTWEEKDDSGSSAAPAEYRAEYAWKDLEDVASADCFVAFTEAARSNTRGGRHVEFGAAVALRKRLFVVGPRENLFYHHPSVRSCDSLDELRAGLRAEGYEVP